MNVLPRVPLVPLGEIAEIDREGIAPELIHAGTKYLGLEHIEAGGRILDVATVGEGEIASTKFRFGSNHLLFGKLRPYLAKIALPDFAGVCSTDILPVLPGDRLDRRYLAHFLRQPSMVDFAASRSTGANLPRLSPKSLAQFAVPLPPLAEQKRIAAILDQADALRRLRRRALGRLNALGKAIFQEMFVARPGDWPLVKIETVTSDARTGPFGSQLLHSEFVDAGIPVLGIDNVVSNQFVWAQPRFITAEKYRGLRRYTVAAGDVLITIMGTCGRCVIVPDDIPKAINTKHICCLTPDRSRVSSEYLRAAFLMHPEVLRQLGVESKGAVMPGLNMGIIKKTEIPLPPLDLQLRFGERIGRIQRQDGDLHRQAASLDSLFSALQHLAFTRQL